MIRVESVRQDFIDVDLVAPFGVNQNGEVELVARSKDRLFQSKQVQDGTRQWELLNGFSGFGRFSWGNTHSPGSRNRNRSERLL